MYESVWVISCMHGLSMHQLTAVIVIVAGRQEFPVALLPEVQGKDRQKHSDDLKERINES